MHSRKQIIENQKNFRKDIVNYLKSEFKQMKKDLENIDTKDDVIKNEQKKLIDKFGKLKISKELEKFFISEKNLYPNYYAWWDEENSQVIKFKYKG
jgi:DNA-binding transcriptional regulator GbsR (MarR family)